MFATVVSNRSIGASTTYPYLADFVSGLTGNDYFQKIRTPGNWEFIFLVGAVFAGLVFSNVDKEFKITVLHSNWKKYHGSCAGNRLAYAMLGGFILIYGARMAGVYQRAFHIGRDANSRQQSGFRGVGVCQPGSYRKNILRQVAA